MIRVKEWDIRMVLWAILKSLGISLGKILTTAVSPVLLQTFPSRSGDIWCSSCCGKQRLRLCNESVRALVQHKANCCLSVAGQRGCLTAGGGNNLLGRRKRERAFGGREPEEDTEL